MLISFKERIREKLLLEKWKVGSPTDKPLTDNQIEELVKNPPQLCDEPQLCESRHLSDNGCICLRSVFENENQFNQWKSAFENDIKERLFVGVDISDIEI